MSEENYDEAVSKMRENIEQLRKTQETVNTSLQDHDEEDFIEEDLDPEEPEYTKTELEAIKKGWNPDKDSIPEGKEWISAGEFLRNEKFFDEIHRLKKQNKDTAEALKELKEHHRKVAEIEREKLLNTLKRQKKEALDEDDHDAVIEIDEKIADIKEASKAAKNASTSKESESDEEEEVGSEAAWANAFNSWLPNNSWYNEDEDLRGIADDLGQAYMAKHNGKVEPTDLFEYVDKRMKKFLPADEKPASKVAESGGRSRRSATRGGVKKFTKKDLNPDQRRAMNTFVRSGVLTEDQYIAELVKIGELS